MREHLCSAWTVTLHFQTLTDAGACAARDRSRTGGARASRVGPRPCSAISSACWSSMACSPATRSSKTRPRALSAASERCHHRRALQLARDDSRDPRRHADAGPGARASAAHRCASAAGRTACGCSIARCRITADRSASSSAQRARRSSAARSGSCTCTRICATRRRWRTSAMRSASFMRCARRIPIGIRAIVPSATLRQANCYYSSSDAAFADRYRGERGVRARRATARSISTAAGASTRAAPASRSG